MLRFDGTGPEHDYGDSVLWALIRSWPRWLWRRLRRAITQEEERK